MWWPTLRHQRLIDQPVRCKLLAGLGKACSEYQDITFRNLNYNFCRIHGSLRVTPAIEVGVAEDV